MAGKNWNRPRFNSKYSQDRIVGVSWRWFSRPRQPKKRLRYKTRSSSVDVWNFCFLPVRAQRCWTVSSSVHWKLVSYRFLWALVRQQYCPVFWGLLQMLECFICLSISGARDNRNGLLSGMRSERRKRSVAALRWIPLMNFCKLTLYLLSSSQMC